MKEPAAKERMIARGLEVLSEQGFAATGLDALLKSAGVPKGSFYHYFRSKSDFGLAVLERYAEIWDRKLCRILHDPTKRPLMRISNYIDESIAGMEKFDFRRGCLIGNLGQELGSLDDALAARIGDVFDSWAAHMEACLKEAVESGEISSTLDPKLLSQFFWASWEGAVLRSKVKRSIAPLLQFRDVMLCLLRTAHVSGSTSPGPLSDQ